ncbi:MAG: hypothetical protein DMF69_24900 [Acidobacteria bacterium]|nr:MAG: hypothetical protein DMF69_24900 [Acidobacteriota bacterium]
MSPLRRITHRDLPAIIKKFVGDQIIARCIYLFAEVPGPELGLNPNCRNLIRQKLRFLNANSSYSDVAALNLR